MDESIELIFSKIKAKSYYIRVSYDHPLELYLGLNENGLKTLRFNGCFTPQKVVGTNLILVKQTKTETGYSILFSFDSAKNQSVFYKFCEDMIFQTRNSTEKDGYNAIVNRYYIWKKMFYRTNNILLENEVMGLIGELLFLKNYAIKKYGELLALMGWSGTESTHKDFSYGTDWYEVKTISNSKPYVTISSTEQLESETLGHLYVYCLEKMSSKYDGISLNVLVERIMEELRLEESKDIFVRKLKAIGYGFDERYDAFVYDLSEIKKYLVDETFPKIILDELPKGIFGVKYNLLLSSIEENKEN